MNRVFLVVLLGLLSPNLALAQSDDKKEAPVEQKAETQKEDKKESFGDYVKKTGIGVWRRIRDRFNLDGATEDLRKKGKDFFGKKQAKSQDDPKTETEEKTKDDKKDT